LDGLQQELTPGERINGIQSDQPQKEIVTVFRSVGPQNSRPKADGQQMFMGQQYQVAGDLALMIELFKAEA